MKYNSYKIYVGLPHYSDIIISTIASLITSLAFVYSTVYSDADQRKHQSSSSLAFVWGIHRNRWIPRTKGQLRGKCFHLMTSSCFGGNYYPAAWPILIAVWCDSKPNPKPNVCCIMGLLEIITFGRNPVCRTMSFPYTHLGSYIICTNIKMIVIQSQLWHVNRHSKSKSILSSIDVMFLSRSEF